jgi:hypothetical protein
MACVIRRSPWSKKRSPARTGPRRVSRTRTRERRPSRTHVRMYIRPIRVRAPEAIGLAVLPGEAAAPEPDKPLRWRNARPESPSHRTARSAHERRIVAELSAATESLHGSVFFSAAQQPRQMLLIASLALCSLAISSASICCASGVPRLGHGLDSLARPTVMSLACPILPVIAGCGPKLMLGPSATPVV